MYTREEVNSPILLFGCQVYLSFFLFAFLSYYFLYILCARIVLSSTLFKNEYLLKVSSRLCYLSLSNIIVIYIQFMRSIKILSLSLSLSPLASTPFDWNNNACDDLSGLSHVT